jgi:hypothetical protein
MKPYGLTTKIMHFRGKVDHHIHEKNKKIGNWWVEFTKIIKRKERRNNKNYKII